MRICLLTLAMTLAIPCHAEFFVSVGGQYNSADVDIDTPVSGQECITLACFIQVNSAPNFGDSDQDTGFQFGGGYRFMEHFAAEISWQDFGDFAVKDRFSSPIDLHSQSESSVKAASASLLAQGTLFDSLHLFARAGLDVWEAHGRISQQIYTSSIAVAGSSSDSDNGVDPFFGVGVRYSFSPIFSVQIEYQKHQIKTEFSYGEFAEDTKLDIDISSTQLSLQYRI